MAFDLTQLDDNQLAAVKDTDGRILIYAGAGAGKTRVVAARVASLVHRGIAPEEHLCITFTNKASEEMGSRIGKYAGRDISGMWVGTFHRICTRILKAYGKHVMIDPNFTIYDETDQMTLMKLVLSDLQVDVKKNKPIEFIGDISNLKRKKTTLNDYNAHLARTKGQDYAELFAKVRRAYHAEMRKANGLDFNDLILETTRLLSENSDIRTTVSSQFKYVHVDEYQDTADVEALLIRHLSSVHGNLCVVGDARQAIYGWRGSDHKIIARFDQDYPGAKIHKLGANYRSGSNIVNAGEALIMNATDLPNYTCYPALSKDGYIQHLAFMSDVDEAAAIAEMIEKLYHAGKSVMSDVAILCRTRTLAGPIEAALISRGISYTKMSGTEFYAKKEIKSAICYLRLIVNPRDDAAAHYVLELLGRGVGKGTVDKLRLDAQANGKSLLGVCSGVKPQGVSGSAWKSLQQFHGTLLDLELLYKTGGSMRVLLETICAGWLKDYCEKDQLSAADRLKNLDDLIAVAEAYTEPAKDALPDFLDKVALVDSSDTETDEKVQLMTIHQAKGLEFTNVFVPGLEENILPHSLAFRDAGGIEEERRLLYVAITRGIERVYLSSSKFRVFHGEGRHPQTSRFVQEVLAA
jgi:DNA helicase II / ATP-dependent DNA helicase PcrA